MIIFPILVVTSFLLYFYYKIIILRTSEEVLQHYYQAKARICLGTFVSSFAISQYIYYQSQLSIIIGLIFLFIGILQIVDAYKASRHYRNEWKR